MNVNKQLITLVLLGISFISMAQTTHPWQGKKVGYIGDSITDPNCLKEVRKYWDFLKEWLNITPHTYAVSGKEWNDVTRQAELLNVNQGKELNAIMVFLGTNDFNSGLPIGEWFTEKEEKVWVATGQPQREVIRKRRTPILSESTFKGRINIGLLKLKQLFPDKQIILLTPLHRAYATFGNNNVQPDESYQNSCNEYFDAYIQAIKEAGSIYSIPVIDLYAISGLNPMIEEQLSYFNQIKTDRNYSAIV